MKTISKKFGIFAISVMILILLIFVNASSQQGANENENLIPVIIIFKEKPSTSAIEAHGGHITAYLPIINGVAVAIPQRAIDALNGSPNVDYIEIDPLKHPSAQEIPWGVERVNAPEVWATTTGNGVGICVLDSGADYDHVDLADNIASGVNFAGWKNDGSANPKDWDDKDGHGTHVAGTIAAINNNIGVVGAAYDADIYVVKVLGPRGGYTSDIIQGIEWCNNNENVKILSMSYGGSYSQAEEDALEAAYNNGKLLVSAAGNEGDDNPDNEDLKEYPAGLDTVIAVASTDDDDSVSYFSTSGSWVELAAPGRSIKSTYKGDMIATMSGTSMACPHVSGVAALVWANEPDLTNIEIRERLQTTAVDLGNPDRDNGYGYGLVDAAAAVGGSGCTSNTECNDNNKCTTDTCNTETGQCVFTPVEDNTVCYDGIVSGICCSGTCSAATCSLNADCDDGNACTIATCNYPGTCGAYCSHTEITTCSDNVSDGCCPAGCNSTTDSDCPEEPAEFCGNGYCAGANLGEDCRTCPIDCPAGARGVCCGDGKCDTKKGETLGNCPVDCL